MKWASRNGFAIYRAEPGESVFTRPHVSILPNSLPANVEFEVVDEAKDVRSFAILSALVIESNLDSLLAIWLPGYKKLCENRDFTLSMKIELLKAMGLLPQQIIAAADVVRDVRNTFAHQLAIKSFENLPQSKKEKINNVFFSIFKIGPDEAECFRILTGYAIQGLRLYTANIKLLRQELENPEFTEALMEKAESREREQVAEILKEGPLQTEVFGGTTIEIYTNGVTVISSEEPLDVKEEIRELFQ